MASFDITIEKRFPFEGGFQNNANDTANYCGGNLIGTNLGISALGYAGFFGSCPSVEQIKALTKEQAKAIYKKNYWDKISGDLIKNQSVSELMFLYIIGNPSTISDLKQIANETAGKTILVQNDNPLTGAEIRLINDLDQQKFHAALKKWRTDFYYRIVKASPNKSVFLNGWLNGISKYIFIPESEADTVLILVICLLALILIWFFGKGLKMIYKIILTALVIFSFFFFYKKWYVNLKNLF